MLWTHENVKNLIQRAWEGAIRTVRKKQVYQRTLQQILKLREAVPDQDQGAAPGLLKSEDQ